MNARISPDQLTATGADFDLLITVMVDGLASTSAKVRLYSVGDDPPIPLKIGYPSKSIHRTSSFIFTQL